MQRTQKVKREIELANGKLENGTLDNRKQEIGEMENGMNRFI